MIFPKLLPPLPVLGLLATLGLAACGQSVPPGQVSDRTAAEAPKESASFGKALADTAITASVQGRLAGDARLSGSQIRVATNNGIVTLGGVVNERSARDAAEATTRATADVRGVDNRIAAPTLLDGLIKNAGQVAEDAGEAISDTAITARLKAALIADPTTRARAINVSTLEGSVTLSGNAASGRERGRALALATGIRGVRSVNADTLKIASR